MIKETAIHTRALLVGLTIRCWTARKLDKRVTRATTEQYGASPDSARVNKLLLPGDCPEYAALTSKVSEIRNWHYAQTLPWNDGSRLLPTANFMAYSDGYRAHAADFARLLDGFVVAYPSLRAHAEQLMSGLFSDADYPSIERLRGKFECSVQYWPVPVEGDIRCDLAADRVAALEQSIGDQLSRAADAATADAVDRLRGVVSKMAERLKDPTAVFRDTLVTNTIDVCDILTRLNVTNDPNLEQLRAEVAQHLTAEPQQLRDDKALRAATAAKADQILATMSGIYGGR